MYIYSSYRQLKRCDDDEAEYYINGSLLQDGLTTFSMCSLFFLIFVKMCDLHLRGDLIFSGKIHRETPETKKSVLFRTSE